MIFASHFSFGSGGGVPAIGCGRGRAAVFVLVFLVDRRGTIFKVSKEVQYCAI